MRWPIFLIALFLMLVLDQSAAVTLLDIRGVAPIGAAIVAVFAALLAPRPTALMACWVAGLAVDLLTEIPAGASRTAPMIGVHALGYVFGGMLVLALRPNLIRRQALTIGIATIVFLLASAIVVVGLFVVHGWYETSPLEYEGRRAGAALLHRAAGALYTGLLGLPIGYLLLLTTPWWNFRSTAPRAIGRR